jgi:thioesterase domain-containing protein
MPRNGASALWRLVAKKIGVIVPLTYDEDCENAEGRIPLYCVHSIAGEVMSLSMVAGLLGREYFMYGIQAPLEQVEANHSRSIEDMAKYYIGLLTAFQPSGPLILGGWSAGAVLALEMARQLRAQGREVPLLFAVDGVLFNTGADLKPWSLAYFGRFLGNLPRWLVGQLVDERERRDWFHQGGRKLLSLAKAVAAVAHGRPAFRGYAVEGFADTGGWSQAQITFAKEFYVALEEYLPRPYPGRVAVYTARTRPLYRLLEVKAGWRRIAERLEIFELPGTHGSILRKPRVAVLAAHLRATLADLHLEHGAAECAREAS